MDTLSNALHLNKSADALIITFNRPEIRNPLSVAVIEDLQRILDIAGSHREIRKVVFTGAREVFASGADLREIAALNVEEAAAFALRGQRLMNAIVNLEKETIAAVNGFCFGGALDLALSCRRRVASPDAIFCHPGAELGIITGWGGTQRLPRLIGHARALEMFYTAKRVTAKEALFWGLIDMIGESPVDSALTIS